MNGAKVSYGYWMALQQIPGLGSKRLLRLVEHFGSAENVWQASEQEIMNLTWMGRAAEELIARRKDIRPAELAEKVLRSAVRVLVYTDPEYPEELKSIYQPPPVLYYRGDLQALRAVKVAVVGTRQASPYGQRVARLLARRLAEAGAVVVSGMAQGIDACAHWGALEGNGKTIAVLGCGVDTVYPRENARLYREIMARGLLLSEQPPGTPPARHYFPARNRIISGLARGTVVVEAGEKSGALITANLALEQGRDVFAVPGPVTSPQSKGANELLKQGAKVVTSVEDILEEYLGPGTGLAAWEKGAEGPGEASLTEVERVVLAAVSATALAVEDIASSTGLSTSEINVALTLLELKGLLTRLPGGLYTRTFPGDEGFNRKL